MKRMFNLTTCSDDLDRFQSREDLLCLMDGFDGVELMYLGEDQRQLILKEQVIGLHMSYFPYWLDLWRGDMEAVEREFGDAQTWERYYGGKDRSAVLDRFKADLRKAHEYEAEYVVFHVSDCSCYESFTLEFGHSDEEVIDAACELLNELFREEDGSLMLLVENLWQPGLTFTRPEMTKRLMDGIDYINKGIMLDTGHLLHTDHTLRTQEEGVAYIHALLDAHGPLCQWIKGVHLNQSLTGEYCERIRKDPPKLGDTFEQRHCQMFSHAFAVDQHLPFTCKGIGDLISRISPEYLTFEFITESKLQHQQYLQAQKEALSL